MSKVSVQKVSSEEDRKLPIFDELREVTDRIRLRAFNLFSKRGFGEGGDLDDWLLAEREVCWPATELVEEDDEFEIKVALAGFDSKDVTVTATRDELIIKASRKNEQEKSEDRAGVKVHWSEFQNNEVYRHIALPSDIDVDNIEAKFEKGMLEIEAPKLKGIRKESAGRKVRISSAD
ncbi:MAG: Hsp20 family protein [Woeseia sp.]